MWQLSFLCLATVVLADYYIDNANVSLTYSMPPSLSVSGWQTFSNTTKELALQMNNQTIPLDSSNCYDQNYALGVCGTIDNCFVEIPFTGSGITIYVFNAGLSGMTANFSIDGGTAVSSTVRKPPPPNYQVSNVSIYDIHGLPTGSHTMRMTLLDWENETTSMKFDYARVNETYVAQPVTTTTSSTSSTGTTSTSASRTSSQLETASATTSAASRSVNVGGIIGASLGGLALATGLVICLLYWRRHKTSAPNLDASPFPTDLTAPSTSHAHPFSVPRHRDEITPLTRSAILRDALAAGDHPSAGLDKTSQPIMAGQSSGASLRPPSLGEDIADADSTSPFSDPENLIEGPPYSLTDEQGEVIQQLRRDNVPPETVTRIIGEFISLNTSTSGRLARQRSIISAAPPPSYQTRDR